MEKEDKPQSTQEKKERQEGVVIEALHNAFFKVKINDGPEVLAHLAGKLRRFRIKILPGDRVIVETSSYDQSRGRIIYRKK